jgi:hypothetical protein
MAIDRSRDSAIWVLRVTGTITLEEFKRAILETFADPAFVRGSPILWDMRDFDTTVGDTSTFSDLVSFNEKSADERGGGRSAIVVSSVVDYGMSRMFQSLADGLPTDFAVFRSYRDAQDWLLDGGEPQNTA